MRAISSEALSSIIGRIYDCVIEPDNWSDTMACITDALDAAYTGIALSSAAGAPPSFAAQSPWDMDQMRLLNTDYRFDEIPGLEDAVAGDVDTPVTTFSSMSEEVFQQTRFFKDWAGPQGLREGCSTKFVHTPDRFGLLLFTTRASRGVVTVDERRFLSMLSPHVRRAALIGDLLDHAQVTAIATGEVLDGLAAPIVLTGPGGSILYANASAEEMLSGTGPITSIGNVLQASTPGMTTALLDAIAGASLSDGALGGRGIGLPLSRPGQPPAVAYVLPLSAGTARAAFHPASAAVFVSTTTAASPLREAVVITLFDLTPAEARVLIKIGGGQSSNLVASSLGISENTLKTHLSRIYAKTGTSRQADLVGLIRTMESPIGASLRNSHSASSAIASPR